MPSCELAVSYEYWLSMHREDKKSSFQSLMSNHEWNRATSCSETIFPAVTAVILISTEHP